MTIRTVLKATEKFVTDNSPGILTGLAVVGTVSTALLTARAAFDLGMDLNAGDYLAGAKYDKKDLVKSRWKDFAPAAITGVATITCIVASNRIGARRTAAITAAFQLSEKLAEEYKERVVKTLGEKKEELMRAELGQERMERTGGSESIIIVGPEVVFYDELSGRFFKHEMEKVRKAVNDINHRVNTDFYASLSDFYDLIGLDRTGFSDEVGWNPEELLEVSFSATLLTDGRPAVAMSYNKAPIRGFDRLQ